MKQILAITTLTLLFSTAAIAKMYSSCDESIIYSGRYHQTSENTVTFGYSGTRLRTQIQGSGLKVKIRATMNPNWIVVFVDGVRHSKIKISPEWTQLSLVEGLEDSNHLIEIVKVTEGFEGNIEISNITVIGEAPKLQSIPLENRRIEFIGDSITCGYGIEASRAEESWTPETENFCDTYAWLTAKALDADYLVVARSGIGMLRNYNGPKEGNKENLPFLYDRVFFNNSELIWEPEKFTPDVVCINLGTNDFSTTGVDTEAYKKAYQTFVGKLLERYNHSKIVCLLGPMLNTPEVKSILQQVAIEANADYQSPRVYHFEMSAQGALGYGADWHPSKQQAQLNAEELTAYLKELMNW